MDINYQLEIPAYFSDDSRVWIYQCNRAFTQSEVVVLSDMLKQFVSNWKSHGTPVKGFGSIFFNQFIILMADETAIQVGGCSTDSSVHLIKSIEQKFRVDLLDRQYLAFIKNEKVELIQLAQFEKAVADNFIEANTLYFNNTVLTKKELYDQWLIPVKDCWLAKRVSFPAPV